MALDNLTKIDGGGISTTSNYRVGIITASKFVGPIEGTITSTDATFTGNVSIAGTLSYEDVTNIDSVGLITARSGIFIPDNQKIEIGHLAGNPDLSINSFPSLEQVSIDYNRSGAGRAFRIRSTFTQIENWNGLTPIAKFVGGVGVGHVELNYAGDKKFETTTKGIQVGTGVTIETNGQTYSTGISTTTENFYIKPDTQQNRGIYIGSNGQLRLQYTGGANQSYLRSSAAFLSIASNNFFIQRYDTNYTMASFRAGQQCKLTYNYVDRIATSGIGATVYGQFDTTNLTIAGVSTFTGAIDANGDLDVDGHTNLDNVSIAGVTTASDNIRIIDSKKLLFGDTNGDMSMYHLGGANSYIVNKANNLYIQSNNAVEIGSVDTNGSSVETSAKFIRNGAAELYYDDIKTAFTGQDQWIVHGRTSNSGMVEIASNQGANNNDRFRIHKTSAASRLTIQNYASGSWVENIRFTSTGEVRIPSGSNTTSRLTFGGAINIYHDGNMKFENATGYLKLQSSNNLYIDGSEIFFRNAGGTNRWRILSTGHFVPGAVGSYDIGSATAEIGDVYIADDKKLQLGSSQDLQIYHTNSGTSWIRHTNSSEYFILEGNQMDFRDYATGVYRARMGTAVQLYYGGNNVKLATTATGIEVTGEVAASQDYPNLRPTLDLNFAAEKKLDPIITYQRTGIASFVNEFGKVVLVGDNAPRFDHDTVTRESKGLLIEESRTNIIYPSSDWSSANYTHENNNTSQESNTTDTEDPAGTFHATKITPIQGNTSLRSIYWGTNITFTNTVKFTMSAFAKSTTGLHVQLRPRGQGSGKAWATFNLTTGVVGNSGGSTLVSTKIEKYPNDWYRCSLTFTGGGHTAGGFGALIMDDGNDGEAATHTGDASKSIFFWGAQFETGSFATSYIPTSSAAVTRGRDIVDIDGEDFTDFYNQTESTILSSHTLLPNVPNAENVYVYQIQDASTNNAIRVIDKNSSYSNVATGLVISGGSSVFHFNNTTDSYTKDKVLVALSVKNNDFAGCHNGGTIETDSSGTLPTNFNSLGIGRYPPSGGYELNGHIQRFIYYPKQLSDSQLKTLTS